MTTEPTTIERAAAIRLMASGFVTIAEVAQLLGSSRQRVRYWAQTAGIDVDAARSAQVAQLWAAEMVLHTGKFPKRKRR